MKKAIAFTLWTVLGLGIYLMITSEREFNATAKQEPATQTYTATQLSCRADAKQGILELNTLESKLECPTFLDAPLGIKHCAAKEEVEATKIIIQDRFDSCTK